MDQTIRDLKSTTFCGRRFTKKQLVQIQKTVKRFSRLSRRELGHTICELFQWTTPNGSNKIQSCLTALEAMEKLSIITLPTKRPQQKYSQKAIMKTTQGDEQSPVHTTLDELTPIHLQIVTEAEEVKAWNEFIDRYHYLGYKRPVGSHLRYYIIDCQGRKLGCLLFSFATSSLPCRDKWIGWNKKNREKCLQYVINNNRFLIFPWVDVKCLASKALSIAMQQIANDWETRHGYRPVLLETFIDSTKYQGTCYKAANWQCIGKTVGRYGSKKSQTTTQKDVYVYPLTRDFAAVLTNEKKPEVTKPTLKPQKHSDIAPASVPFVQLWQKVIVIVNQVAGEFDQQWQKRRRVLNTLLIMLFIFRLVFSKNKQSYGSTITELWEQCQVMGIPLPQPKPVAASAFCNARAKLDETIFKTLNTKIIQIYNPWHNIAQWRNHRIFAVDGTKINLPRQMKDEGYRLNCEHAYYPQGLVSCLYELNSKMPVDFELVPTLNERTAALTHLQVLKENDVVVYDRGYFSYAMLYYHVQQGVHAVFRIPKSFSLALQEFMDSNTIEQVIMITLVKEQRRVVCKRHPDIIYRPLPLRLIKYTVKDTTYVLGTTLMDSQQYPIMAMADLYHCRWRIEELYKVSKELIDVEDFHAQSERGVKQELFAHFVLITLSRIFTNEVEIDFNKNKTFLPHHRIQANLKNCLRTMARNLEALFLQQAALVKETLNTIIRSISTCQQKQRPHRSYKRQSRKPIPRWQVARRKKQKEKTQLQTQAVAQ